MKRQILFVMMMCAIVAVAGDKGKKKAMPSEEEMMKRWVESATPGEAHKMLDRFAGSWETQTTAWMGGPGKPPTVTKGTAQMKWILGGRFLQQDVQGEMMGQPMTGFGINGYDNFKKKYTFSWVDNTSTAMFSAEGTPDKKGETVTYFGKMDEPATGEKNKTVKYVMTMIDHDNFTFEIHDPALPGPNKKVVEISYRRKN